MIVGPNETIAFKSEVNELYNIFKKPRGIMAKVENSTFWNECSDCFASVPRGMNKTQPWFKTDHKHDKGAIVNGENILVN